MKVVCVLVVLVLVMFTFGFAQSAFTVTSKDIPEGTLDNAEVFNGFGCTGENISPELTWSSAPEGTKSFAVTVYDPDAPTGSGWWHWIVYNIPATVTKLETNAGNLESALAPEGSVQSNTDFGVPGFGGACPPEGSEPHRYIFTVYALGVEKLELPENATGALVGFNLNDNSLGTATLTATYGR